MRGGSMVFSIKELPDKERIPDARIAGNLVDTAYDEITKLNKIPAGTVVEEPPELKVIEEKIKTLQNDADEIGHKIVSEVQEHELSMEESYEGLDFLSYVLYFVGWGLALIGRLYEHAEQEIAE